MVNLLAVYYTIYSNTCSVCAIKKHQKWIAEDWTKINFSIVKGVKWISSVNEIKVLIYDRISNGAYFVPYHSIRIIFSKHRTIENYGFSFIQIGILHYT